MQKGVRLIVFSRLQVPAGGVAEDRPRPALPDGGSRSRRGGTMAAGLPAKQCFSWRKKGAIMDGGGMK